MRAARVCVRAENNIIVVGFLLFLPRIFVRNGLGSGRGFDLLAAFLDAFPPPRTGEGAGGSAAGGGGTPAAPAFDPLDSRRLFSPAVTASLLSGVVDSWDGVRARTFDVLARFPSPLPGLETPAAVLPVLRRACALLRSPRLRESDAGALLVRLLCRKCALEWLANTPSCPKCRTAADPRGASRRDVARDVERAVAAAKPCVAMAGTPGPKKRGRDS